MGSGPDRIPESEAFEPATPIRLSGRLLGEHIADESNDATNPLRSEMR
jgi:hypothetical protein